MKKTLIALSLVAALLLIFAIVLDLAITTGAYSRHFLYEKDCSYTTPKDWRLVYNGKFYAINSVGTDRYLWSYNGRLQTISSTLSLGDLFVDSCTAKSALKEYISPKDKMEDFK